MGKSKKKKQKSADFQKVKLKVGKRKPVGTNVTNTSFRTSSIQIASQLEKGSEPTNKRQLSLKELLTHLHHYNVTIRHESLLGLLELFQMHPEVMRNQISMWIPKILEKVTDTDIAVRHAVHLCLNHAFKHLSEEEISPFFKIIIAHVSCGMTHINSGVQLDALAILDLALSEYPITVVQYSNKVLTHFMDLISKQSSKEKSSGQTMNRSKVKGVSAIVNRELSVDVHSQISSLKVRSQVLEKLHKFLLIVHKEKQQSGVSDSCDNNTEAKEVQITNDKLMRIQVYKYSLQPPHVCNVDLDSWLSNSIIKSNSHDFLDTYCMEEFMHTMFPVILNCWVEYEPSQLASCLNDSRTMLSSLPGMKAIINIIAIMTELLYDGAGKKHWQLMFYQDCFKDFSTYFLQYFALPISNSSTKSINRRTKLDPIHVFALDFNFVMSSFLCNFLLNAHSFDKVFDVKLSKRYLKEMMSFATNIIENCSMLVDDKVTKFLNILKDLMEIGTKMKDELINIPTLLKQLVKLFTKASITSPWKIPIVKFFYTILSSDWGAVYVERKTCLKHIYEFIERLIINVWSLPATSEKLIKESFTFIKLVLVCNVNNQYMGSALDNSMLSITSSLTNSFFCQVDLKIQRLIIEVLYNMDRLPDDLIKNLALICHNDEIQYSVKTYIISVLGNCLKQDTPSIQVEAFINFILTVVLGSSSKELMLFNMEDQTNVSWSMLTIISSPGKNLPIQYALDHLKVLDNYQMLWQYVAPAIRKLIVMFRCIPFSAAVGLLELLNKLLNWNSFDKKHDSPVGSEINQVADLISAGLLYCCSPTYQSTFEVLDNDHVQLLLKPARDILINNQGLVRHLVKKYIHILGEYKMESLCVVCIIEVLVSLLKDPAVQTKFVEMKLNLASIVDTFSRVNSDKVVSKSLVQQFGLLVSLL